MAIVAVGVVASFVASLVAGVTRLDVALSFALLIAIGDLMRVRLPGNRPAAPIALAAAIGYAMLFNVGGRPVQQSVAQVVWVVGAGCCAGSVVHLLARRRPHWPLLARRVVSAALVSAAIRLTAPQSLTTLDFSQFKQELRWVAILLVAIVALACIVDVVLAAAIRSGARTAAFGWSVRDEFGAATALWAAVGATGVLTALATPSMNLYALPTFCVPLLLTQFAYRRYAAIRTTYRETIRSLSRVTEVGGYVEEGHAHRVGLLAVAVGRELGLTEGEIAELEYAALLHDIGQLSLTDPIPGGSTLVVAPVERRRVAELGADVIKTTGVLDRVAEIVARQADPYRRHREAADDTLPVESRIIKAVSAYDDLVGKSDNPDASADALERLRLGMAYEYDPQVVQALARVVTRKTARLRQNSA
ncbi:MAG: HD-GYP domain-containing protein [Acidothermaceae bacterium]